MSKYLILILFALLAVSGNCKGAEVSSKPNCSNSTKNFYSVEWNGKSDERISALEALRDLCAKNGNYILAMTTAYFSNEEWDKAIEFGNSNYGILSKQEKQGVLRFIFMSYAYEDNDSGQLFVISQAGNEFPEDNISYLLKGLYNQNLNKWPEAIMYFEKSNQIGVDFEAFLGLSIGYYNSNKFQESADAYFSACRLNPDTVSYLTSTLSASASLYELARYKEAQKALDDHLAVVPASSSDENVLKIMALLKTRNL